MERYNLLCNIQKKEKKMVGESTPAYIFYLDLIDTIYPNIKKICILRDPKDRIVSMHFNNVLKGRVGGESISRSFIEQYCAERINIEYACLLNYHEEIFCTTYEMMVKNPKVVASECFQYLKVENTESILQKAVGEASFENMTAREHSGISRHRGKESRNSHLRKGIVGDNRNYLTAELRKLVDDSVSRLQNRVCKQFELYFPDDN